MNFSCRTESRRSFLSGDWSATPGAKQNSQSDRSCLAEIFMQLIMRIALFTSMRSWVAIGFDGSRTTTYPLSLHDREVFIVIRQHGIEISSILKSGHEGWIIWKISRVPASSNGSYRMSQRC